MSRFHSMDGVPDQPQLAFQTQGGRHGRLRTLHGKDSPPPPDPRIGEAAGRQMALAEEQYKDFKSDFAPVIKQQMGQGIRIAEDQNRRQTAQQEYQMAQAKQYDDRWRGVQVPLEDELISKARTYNEAAEQERMGSEAGADVGMAFDRNRQQVVREQNRRGVNPFSGSAMSMDNQISIAKATAEAGAINKTRQAAKDIGWTRLGESAALGRGLPGFGSTSAQLSMGAGREALGAGTMGVGLAGGASGFNNSGFTAGGSLYGNVGTTLNASNSTQAQAAAGQKSPFGAILGTVAGAAGTAFAGPIGGMAAAAAANALTSSGSSSGGGGGR